MKTPKELLIHDVASTANWRWEKAEQYPTDGRSTDAALYLQELEVYIQSLPEDHSIFEWYDQCSENILDGYTDLDDFRASLKSFGYQWQAKPEEWINEILGIEN